MQNMQTIIFHVQHGILEKKKYLYQNLSGTEKKTVSYTHLDVYKRQVLNKAPVHKSHYSYYGYYGYYPETYGEEK